MQRHLQWVGELFEALQMVFATVLSGLGELKVALQMVFVTVLSGLGELKVALQMVFVTVLSRLGELKVALQMVFVTAHFWIGLEEGKLRQNRISCAVPRRGGLPKRLPRCRVGAFSFIRL